MTLEAWHDFFVAQAGASAALAGLFFVALSINVARIIAAEWLPPRAAATMVLLVGALIEALLALWPQPSSTVLGYEELLVALYVWVSIIRHTIAGSRNVPKEFHAVTVRSAIVAQIATLPAAGGALALSFGAAGGLYAIAFGMLMAIAIAFLNSWVLLVEILR